MKPAERVKWRVVRVEVVGTYRLRVEFADGLTGDVIMDQFLRSDQIGVFEPLRNPVFFEQVGLSFGAVTWPGELDLAPDAMYDDIKKSGFSEVGARS